MTENCKEDKWFPFLVYLKIMWQAGKCGEKSMQNKFILFEGGIVV